MCIGIRTILYKESVVYLQAGGGIVYDSDPKSEFSKTYAVGMTWFLLKQYLTFHNIKCKFFFFNVIS